MARLHTRRWLTIAGLINTPLVALLLITLFLLAGCTQHHAVIAPKNPSGQFYGTPKDAGNVVIHQQPAATVYATNNACDAQLQNYAPFHYRVDQPLSVGALQSKTRREDYLHLSKDLALSPGDLLDIQIENGEGFSGRYAVSHAGTISLPYLEPITVHGLTARETAEKVELVLVRNEFFQPSTNAVHVHIIDWSEIEITVMGAVFEPGRKFINGGRNQVQPEERQGVFGDYSNKRLLSEALRAGAGVRPDAKLDQVILVRNGWQAEIDMSGVFTGRKVMDIPLIAGDQVIVPSTGCFQPNLVRPSQITPKGFRVFLSNLIIPSTSNANAAVGSFSSSLPYGSRLLQAAVSANCAGGTQWTNAPRKVVLASTNPVTGQFQVIERSIEQLMRQAHDDTANPYLMPNDAVACYDSDITNLRDVARTVFDILSPLKSL